MDRSIKPRAATFSGDGMPSAPAAGTASPTSPRSRRRVRVGWKPTILREETFAQLRVIQKSTTDPVLDVSYLSDACVQLALGLGQDAIVRRALADLLSKACKG
jgi:hypothetical protein